MNFSKVETGCLCWICPGDRLLPLPDVDRTTLRHRASLQWVPGDVEVVQPAVPPPLFTCQAEPSSSSQPTSADYAEVQKNLRSLQEEQVSLRAYVASENVPLCDFIQEWHDELCGMLTTQTQYFQDYKACLETYRDWHIFYGHLTHPPPPRPF